MTAKVLRAAVPPRIEAHCGHPTRNGPCGKRPGHVLPHRSKTAMRRQIDVQNEKVRQWRAENPELAKAYSRETAAAWRKANREYDRERAKRYPRARDAVQRQVQEIKLAIGCADCGYRDHAEALEFDHRDPKQKVSSIAVMITWHAPWEAILLEMAKCDVVCANCHRIRTVRRRGDESDAQ